MVCNSDIDIWFFRDEVIDEVYFLSLYWNDIKNKKWISCQIIRIDKFKWEKKAKIFKWSTPSKQDVQVKYRTYRQDLNLEIQGNQPDLTNSGYLWV